MVLEHPGPVKVLGPGRCKRFSAFIDDGKVHKGEIVRVLMLLCNFYCRAQGMKHA